MFVFSERLKFFCDEIQMGEGKTIWIEILSKLQELMQLPNFLAA